MSENNGFFGREAELGLFLDLLAQIEQQPKILYIYGPGGIGKTQLILKMLAAAQSRGNVLVCRDLIDVTNTSYRHLDGIQLGIIEALDTPPEFRSYLIGTSCA